MLPRVVFNECRGCLPPVQTIALTCASLDVSVCMPDLAKHAATDSLYIMAGTCSEEMLLSLKAHEQKDAEEAYIRVHILQRIGDYVRYSYKWVKKSHEDRGL